MNFGPLAAEIGSLLWGAPINFNGFRFLALLLQRRRSTEANQTLHDIWPSPGLVHCIYIFGALAPLRNFAGCKIHYASKSCALQNIGSVTARHSSSGRQPNCGVEQRAPYIFGRAAITLEIGSHASCISFGTENRTHPNQTKIAKNHTQPDPNQGLSQPMSL